MGIEAGNWAAWGALALSVITAIVSIIRAGRRSHLEKVKEQKRVTDEAQQAVRDQADHVTVWVEYLKDGPPEVIVRNASNDPIRFVVAFVSRVGKPAEENGAINAEILTIRAVGPGRGNRTPITITANAGIIVADTTVRFIDKNGQGWQRNARNELTQVDYKPEDYAQFDTGVREGFARGSHLESVGTTHVGNSEQAVGRWALTRGNGNGIKIPLHDADVIAESNAEYTVRNNSQPRATFRLDKAGHIVEVELLNLPRDFFENPPDTPDPLNIYGTEDGGAAIAFYNPDADLITNYPDAYTLIILTAPEGGTKLGHVTYAADHRPLHIVIYDADNRLASISDA